MRRRTQPLSSQGQRDLSRLLDRTQKRREIVCFDMKQETALLRQRLRDTEPSSVAFHPSPAMAADVPRAGGLEEVPAVLTEASKSSAVPGSCQRQHPCWESQEMAPLAWMSELPWER